MNKLAALWMGGLTVIATEAFSQESTPTVDGVPVIVSFYGQPALVASYPSGTGPLYLHGSPAAMPAAGGLTEVRPSSVPLVSAPPASVPQASVPLASVPLTNRSLAELVGSPAVYLPSTGSLVWAFDTAPRFGPPRLGTSETATASAAGELPRRY